MLAKSRHLQSASMHRKLLHQERVSLFFLHNVLFATQSGMMSSLYSGIPFSKIISDDFFLFFKILYNISKYQWI